MQEEVKSGEVRQEEVLPEGVRLGEELPSERAFHHFQVQHFCPVAQALERLGDRWAFLIVRDLLRGPQRFTDLSRYLAGITPKRLTSQLRALEAEGIVEREHEPGRREVWYRLTAKGWGLVPVIKALALWGFAYPKRLPLQGETVYPEHVMEVLGHSLNQRGLRLPQPVTWTVRFGATSVYTIRFDGTAWSIVPSDAPTADVCVETTPSTWVTFLLSSPEERQHLQETMRIRGTQAHVAELLAITTRAQQQ